MILFNFHVSPKCGGCRYLKEDMDDWRLPYGTRVIKCAKPDNCNINPNRNVEVKKKGGYGMKLSQLHALALNCNKCERLNECLDDGVIVERIRRYQMKLTKFNKLKQKLCRHKNAIPIDSMRNGKAKHYCVRCGLTFDKVVE